MRHSPHGCPKQLTSYLWWPWLLKGCLPMWLQYAFRNTPTEFQRMDASVRHQDHHQARFLMLLQLKLRKRHEWFSASYFVIAPTANYLIYRVMLLVEFRGPINYSLYVFGTCHICYVTWDTPARYETFWKDIFFWDTCEILPRGIECELCCLIFLHLSRQAFFYPHFWNFRRFFR